MLAFHRRNHRKRGLTIVEALLAATLGSLVALMALSLLPSAMRNMATSADQLQASDLASEMMSRLEALGYGSLQIGTWDGRVPDDPANAGAPSQFPPNPYPTVQRRFVEGNRERVTDYGILVKVEQGTDRAGAAASDLKTVEVVVYWQALSPAGGTRPRSLSVKTMVSSL